MCFRACIFYFIYLHFSSIFLLRLVLQNELVAAIKCSAVGTHTIISAVYAWCLDKGFFSRFEDLGSFYVPLKDNFFKFHNFYFE